MLASNEAEAVTGSMLSSIRFAATRRRASATIGSGTGGFFRLDVMGLSAFRTFCMPPARRSVDVLGNGVGLAVDGPLGGRIDAKLYGILRGEALAHVVQLAQRR